MLVIIAPLLGLGGLGHNTFPMPGSARAAAINGEIVIGPRHLGAISRYLFGANLLWADDAEGAFDAAEGSFYPGFVRALSNLGVTALRYPGGTTSDNFNWELAIGPQRERQANEPYGMQAARLSSICCVLDGPERSTVARTSSGGSSNRPVR